MPEHPARSEQRRALRARDAGLRRISTTTRVLVVGSVAASGGFAALAAWAQPGRSASVRSAEPVVGQRVGAGSGFGTRAQTGSAPTTTTAVPASDGNPSNGSTDDLTPPTAAPAPSDQYNPPTYQYSPPVVVSGAS